MYMTKGITRIPVMMMKFSMSFMVSSCVWVLLYTNPIPCQSLCIKRIVKQAA